MKYKTIDINNYKQAYFDEGNGKTILLIHGSLGDLRSWENQIKLFSINYRTISVSLRNCFPDNWDGMSDDFSISQHVSDTVEFIKKLNLKEVNIIGHSRGASLVLKLVSEFQSFFKSAILMDPAPFAKLFQSDPSMLEKIGRRNDIVNKAISFFQIGQLDKGLELFTDSVSVKGTWGNLSEGAKQIRRQNAWSLKSLPLDAETDIIIEKIKNMKLPTLLVSGQNSPEIYKKMHEKLERYLPSFQKVIIDNASHGMHRDNPRAFNYSIQQFLIKKAERIRLDCESGANHNLNRLLDKPGYYI